jgi:hypothetical protein
MYFLFKYVNSALHFRFSVRIMNDPSTSESASRPYRLSRGKWACSLNVDSHAFGFEERGIDHVRNSTGVVERLEANESKD